MKIIIWMIWNESYVIQNDIDHDNIYIYRQYNIINMLSIWQRKKRRLK